MQKKMPIWYAVAPPVSCMALGGLIGFATGGLLYRLSLISAPGWKFIVALFVIIGFGFGLYLRRRYAQQRPLLLLCCFVGAPLYSMVLGFLIGFALGGILYAFSLGSLFEWKATAVFFAVLGFGFGVYFGWGYAFALWRAERQTSAQR